MKRTGSNLVPFGGSISSPGVFEKAKIMSSYEIVSYYSTKGNFAQLFIIHSILAYIFHNFDNVKNILKDNTIWCTLIGLDHYVGISTYFKIYQI